MAEDYSKQIMVTGQRINHCIPLYYSAKEGSNWLSARSLNDELYENYWKLYQLYSMGLDKMDAKLKQEPANKEVKSCRRELASIREKCVNSMNSLLEDSIKLVFLTEK